MDVSIIIVGYNTKALLKQCLISVFEKTQDIDFEVIVVDNASCDGSQQMLKEDFPNVLLIESPENLGFGRANNEGIKIAKGRNILFLNPDTLLLNNAIKILSDYLDENELAGACGGNLYDEFMKPTLSYAMKFPSISEKLRIYKLLNWKNREFNSTMKTMEVACIIGADLMIRKSVLDEVGIFSDRFFMYDEELELCFRIHKARYKLISVPFAKIQHLEGKSFNSKLDPKRIMYTIDGRKTFYSLHYSTRYIQIANFVYICVLYFKISVFYIINKDKYKFWSLVKQYEK
ncbi:MAG: glycosyltransferase family 2 protein [Bacteroidales bacterium]|jgi:GT2 family glycosyltransferase|nr:glycosyltransferase family 2 protein [Bacteroidales bacterium]